MTTLSIHVADAVGEDRPITVSPFVIGRDGDCDLVLDDPRVSRRHAQIEVQPDGRLVLRDLGSETGTFVGDQRIDGGAWFAVPGSFRVSSVTLEIGEVTEPAPPPAVAAGAAPTAETPPPAVLWAPVSENSASVAPVRFRSSRTRGRVAMVALALAGLLEVLAVIHLATFGRLVDDVVSGAAGAADAERFDTTTAQIAGAYLLVLIVAGIAYLAWLSRAVENAPALGAGTTPHSPRGAIGWWFVPFANFIVPYQIVSDLHDRLATPTDSNRARPLLLAWWLTWIGGTLISYGTRLAGDDTVDQLKASVTISLVSDAVTVVSAVLAILVVWRILRREDARASAPVTDEKPAAAAAV
ncbi:MAG: DUF4328 domain-containing protein [Chloroflexota bacterium]